MSALDDPPVDTPTTEIAVPGGLSLQDRIAAQEHELEQTPEHAIILPIPWLSGLSVQYRALSMRECYRLEARNNNVKDEYEKNLLCVCDKLINACDGILEVVEGSEQETYQQTGYKWGAAAARDLFRRSVEDTCTARQGLLAIFPDEEILFDHFAAYEEQRKAVRTQVDGSLGKASGVSSAAT